MNHAHYIENELFVEDVSVKQLAEEYGTPCYVYSLAELHDNIHRYQKALADQSHCIAYAVKANSNLSVLKQIDAKGLGFDIVSVGEFKRLLHCQVDSRKVFFSGVGKTLSEIEFALLHDVGCFNVESQAELERIVAVATKHQRIAPVAIRINPNVDPKTHPYISTGQKHNKFGVETNVAESLFDYAEQQDCLSIKGLSFHIGSQLQTVEPILEAFRSAMIFVKHLKSKGISLEFIDIGGGLGVAYHEDEHFPEPDSYLPKVIAQLKQEAPELTLVIEPGRSIVASAGMLVTQVQLIKSTEHGHFAVVDAGMNDFGRPSLYDAYHQIWPIEKNELAVQSYDVVGPICESADFLAKNRELATKPEDYLAVLHTGAYGMTMSSNYNTRGRIVELLVDGDHIQLIRQRETFEDLIKHEVL